ncbi:unnamed protein product [Scytosiphon promiscuus]
MSAVLGVARAANIAVSSVRHCRRRTTLSAAAAFAVGRVRNGENRRAAAGTSGSRRSSVLAGALSGRRASSTTADGDVLYLPMPKLSPSMTRGTVTKWLKAEGDEVNEYDAILELSTDSLYAPGDAPVEGAPVEMIVELAEYGFVGKLFVAEGDTVEVGQAVMAMCEEEENIEAVKEAKNPEVDFYRDADGGGAGLRIATYQGYLNGKKNE